MLHFLYRSLLFKKDFRVFPWRLTSRGICNNSPLFKSENLLFFFYFLELFVGGGGQGCDEGDKDVIGGFLKSSYSTRENPALEEYLENLKKISW